MVTPAPKENPFQPALRIAGFSLYEIGPHSRVAVDYASSINDWSKCNAPLGMLATRNP